MEEKVESTDHWPKCWSAPFIGKSFYFRSDEPRMERITAWTSDLDRAKKLFYIALDRLPQTVGVLLKMANRTEDAKVESWQRYFNETPRSLARAAIQENENLIFRESNVQLCVRDQKSGEYIVFDEWGTNFIYSPNRWYDSLCEELGYKQEHPADHVSAFDHFSLHPEETEVEFQAFLTKLNLEPSEPFQVQ